MNNQQQRKPLRPILGFVLILIFVSLACTISQPASTSTPETTAAVTVIPPATQTPRPSPTLRSTPTPNVGATQRIKERSAETQKYFDMDLLKTNDGTLIEYADFVEQWAQIGWYQTWSHGDVARDFYMSAHFKWSSSYRAADASGCGFIFARQDNGDHYAVFLDRSKILFVETSRGIFNPVGVTRGTGRVKFDNPADHPVEADFTLIVKDAYAYVLVNGEVLGEYTLSRSKALQGKVGMALLSGTNKGYGTHCEMTDFHLWIPRE